MGTVGRGLPGQLEASLNTTSDVVSLHKYLRQLVSDGVPTLAMEVSSHGLDQGRVSGVSFEVALFTHISRDHLDYHGSLEIRRSQSKTVFRVQFPVCRYWQG